MSNDTPHVWGKGHHRPIPCSSRSPVTGAPCAGHAGHPGPHSDQAEFTRNEGTFADISDGPG